MLYYSLKSAGKSTGRKWVTKKVLTGEERTNWIEYLGLVRNALALPKVDAPVDVASYLNKTKATFNNPVMQAFQINVQVLDKEGNVITLGFPERDTISHVRVAQESGNFAVLQVYLEAAISKPSGREALNALALLEIYQHKTKPLGFKASAGTISGDTLPDRCNGIMANWIALNGEVQLSPKVSKRKAKEPKEPFYKAQIADLKARAKSAK